MGQWQSVDITTVGANGSAAGTGDINIVRGGFVTGIQVDYRTMPATTDVVIRERLPNGSFRALLTLTSQNTDTSKVVQVPTVDPDDVATGQFVYPSVGSTIQVDVAQADAGAPGVVVSVLVE